MTRLRYPFAVAALVALTVLFITNRRYVYSESLGALPALTPAHIVDPRHAGATFRIIGEVGGQGSAVTSHSCSGARVRWGDSNSLKEVYQLTTGSNG